MIGSKTQLRAFRVGFFCLSPVARWFTRSKYLGLENLPKDEGFIICANHVSFVDPVLVGYMLWKSGFPPHFFAKASLFKVPILGFLMYKADQILVKRDGFRGLDALKKANSLLENKSVVVIYPEGTLTKDVNLWPAEFKTGAIRLALDSGKKIVPLAHWGSQNVFSKKNKVLSFFSKKDFVVSVGEPLDFSHLYNDSLHKENFLDISSALRTEIIKLLEDIRGEKMCNKK